MKMNKYKASVLLKVDIAHKAICLLSQPVVSWSYGVMVSTLDFESSDPSSNLGRTFIFASVQNQWLPCIHQLIPIMSSKHCLLQFGRRLIYK